MRPTPAVLLPLALAAASTAAGQEFRVHTVVSDVPAGDEPVELARSLTLFHAGQSWDYAVEAGEVVRFDPGAAAFTVLDLRRDLACEVSLAEVDRRLTVGRQETEKYLAQIAADPAAAGLSRELAFQLNPRFAVADRDGGALHFGGGPIEYDVTPATPKSPGTAAFYLDYADWTARLNYALRPGDFPGVRTAVNAELRERGVVPQRVVKTVAGAARPAAAGVVQAGATAPAATVRRAEHTFQESLAPRDRELLAEWRGRLAAGAARRVTFREYVRLTTGAVAER